MSYRRLYFLIALFFGNLAPATALTITSGYFETLSGDFNWRTYHFSGDDGSVFDHWELGSGGWRADFCTATCLMDFSGFIANNTWGQRSLAGVPVGYWLLSFNMTGPLVSATALNLFPDSPPRGWTFETDWGPVPVAITGTLRLFSLAQVETQVNFTMAGVASAKSHNDLRLSDTDFTTARVDFVPEVGSAGYALAGLVGVLLLRRGRPAG